MSTAGPFERIRACVYFLIAAIYFYFARIVAEKAAHGLGFGGDLSVLKQILFLFLLLVGYAGMGYAFQHQSKPLEAMGLARRSGWFREFGIGVAFGWGMIVACVLPIALFGGLAVSISRDASAWAGLLADLAVLLVAALAEEIGFRGYPFQRIMDAMGASLGTIFMATVFALIHSRNPSASAMSMTVTFLSGLLFAMAYLRTRALWMAWGIHFSWNAAMGLLFGLPISGIGSFSPVIASDAMGPLWLTGGEYGPEGSLVAAIVLIAGLFVLYRITHEYAFKYAQPVIVAGGIPVDIAPPATHQTMAAAETTPSSGLIQIQPAAPPPPIPLAAEPSSEVTVPGQEEKSSSAEKADPSAS